MRTGTELRFTLSTSTPDATACSAPHPGGITSCSPHRSLPSRRKGSSFRPAVKACGYWDAVANGAGWGRPTNSFPGDGAVYSILRLDLKTGVSEPWFTRAGVLAVVGVDVDGYPIVMVTPKIGPNSSDLELWLVTGRDQGRLIYSAPSVVNGILVLGLVTPVIGDAHGIWFEAGPRLYLYSQQSGLQDMAPARAALAGGCA
jgi:hypothetical protein